jgi:O-antigen/teichoic acid export membrane protein
VSLKKDILTTGFIKVFRRLVLGFASTLILTRWLGPEGLGLYTAFMVVPLILKSLGELGIRQSAAYMTGKKLAAETQVAGALASFWMLSSVFSLVLVLAAYYVQGMHREGLVYVLLGMSLAPAGLIARYANGIALGKQWISRLNIGETLHVVVRVGLLAALLIGLHSKVPGALIAELIAAVAPGLLMLYWLRRDLGVSFVPLWDKGLIFSLVTHGFKFALALFVLNLNYRASILILQRFVSHSDIGQFSLGVSIAALIWMIPDAVGMVTFSHSTGAGDPKRFANTTSQIMRLTLLVCGSCAVCVGVFCKPLVVILFGPEYLPSVPVIRVMLPGCVAAVTFKVLHADLAGRGYPLAAMWVYLGALGVNVAGALILIPQVGAIGAAIASSLSYIAGAVVYAMVYARMSGLKLMGVFYQPVSDWQMLKASTTRLSAILRRKRQCTDTR